MDFDTLDFPRMASDDDWRSWMKTFMFSAHIEFLVLHPCTETNDRILNLERDLATSSAATKVEEDKANQLNEQLCSAPAIDVKCTAVDLVGGRSELETRGVRVR